MTNTDCSRNVFFFGAGFSKSINSAYPTLHELSTEINNSYQTETSFIANYLHSEISEKHKENIEKLLTYLSADLPYKTSVQSFTDKALYKDISNKIATYFNNKPQCTDLNNYSTEISQFMNFILDDRSTCITLNYDILLEQLLNLCASIKNKRIDFIDLYNAPLTELNPAGNIQVWGMGDPEPISRDCLPDIIKLHGSINWGNTENNGNLIYHIKDGDEDYRKSHLQTYIIPPVLDKTIFYSNHVLKAIWQRAYEKLSNAKNIYIYGFSFPETDYSIRFLFQSALRNNTDCKVYVVNRAENLPELRSRYEKIFSPIQCNFECCKDGMQMRCLMQTISNNNASEVSND